VAQDRKYHFGTNAIEFSPDPNNSLGYKIVKFFTYGPEDANGVQHRLTAADLDGRGVKHMPMICVVCHGGTLYPPRADGSFDPISLKSPKLNILQQHTLEFSSKAGFTEADMKDGIAAINQMVYNTYVEMGLRTDTNNGTNADDRDDEQANWYSTFAEELIEGIYGDATPGDGMLEQNTDYQAGAIPAGWQQTPARPNGVESLFKQVIEPHCIGCHSLRGTKVARRNDQQLGADHHPNAVNFSTYEEFIGYKDLIIDYVYRRGAMPRSLINYSQFWNDPDGAPTLLASFLPGFDVFDGNGKVVEPGKSVARPGADRTVASTPLVLDSSASLFTSAYSWRIVSSTDPNAALDDPSSAAPVLTAADGTTVLELITSNANGSSDPAQVTITVDSGTAIPAAPTFVSDIMVLLNTNCASSCHSALKGGAGSLYEGIPVYYDEASYTDKKDLYQNVLNRLDLADPENSLLLRKPTSLQHGGSTVLTKTSDSYITLLNWIRNGAPCGNDMTFCD
jgi:mono/diheme cytochrome c family protein